MIQLSDVHKAFGDHQVLRGVDFSVARGEVVCLIGPSGSGKSTALRCINGLERFDRGAISVDEIALTDRTLPKVRA
jgi:polar amino acid transport system ATP-binding protein